MNPARIAVCVLAVLLTGAFASGEEPLTATSRQAVHPVLIRNEADDLQQVTIRAPEGRDTVVTALEFTLEGTDDPGDIDSLDAYFTGAKTEFAAADRFGESAATKANERVRFVGRKPLKPGDNVFWLACRLKPSASLHRRVDAVCTAIETTAGTIVPRNDSPGVRRRIGVALRRHNDDGVHTYRIPALATTTKGTLLCAYDMRRRAARDLQEDIDIGISRSVDGGQTWESPRVVMDMGEHGGLPQEQNGCSDPGLIVDANTGEILCFALWMWGKPGKHQWRDDGSEAGYEIGKTAQFLMVRSRDDGRTWSKPENLTRRLKPEAWWLFAPSPQQGFTHSDGTLVMPAQGRDEKGGKFSTLMISRDHGETWTIGTPAHRGGSECQAIPLSDGSILLNCRNDLEKFRAVYVTKDFGQSWTPHPTNRNTLIEPTCNASLRRIEYVESGEQRHVLLFANPHSQKARTHQTLQVSFDEGRTWPESHRTLLDEGRGAGYPSLTQIDGKHVGIVYEGSRAHIVFERFTIDELVRGRQASPSPP